jgi:hypothetical protein
MPKMSISQTSAFKLCEDGTCDEPKPGQGHETLECKKTDKCKGGGCYCQLFERDHNAKENDPWDVTPLDGTNEAKKKGGLDYKCICVKPILPEGYTICDEPLCHLSEVPDAGSGKATVECTGTCADTCTCNLFRLHVKPKEAEKKAAAKWEFVDGPNKKIERAKGYYYRCFCSKKS